jgi:hypothetical protein
MQEICHGLWDDPQINWDGKVLGCCRNFWGDFGGNAFTDGLVESLNSERMNYAKEMLLGQQPARSDIPCTTCNIYIDMVREENWLRRSSKRKLLESLVPLSRFIPLKFKSGTRNLYRQIKRVI